MELNYKKYGDSTNVVLIVHGLFGMLDNWHNIARQLAPDFTVYTVDVRNHGGSPQSVDMTYDLISDDLSEFFEKHSIAKASFVGHSMGGKAVMKLADLYPGLIDKLCVVDIAPKKYLPGHLHLFKAMFDLPIGRINSRSEADHEFAKSVQDPGVRLFLLKNLQRQREGGFNWKLNLQSIFDNYETISDKVTLNWPFSNPTLFISGELSNYVTEADQDQILELFPNAEFNTIPNAGHWVHAENPKAFYKVLYEFLS